MSSAKLKIPGQVAQLVERSPEKAGVGGSIPSLATTSYQTLPAETTFETLITGVHLGSISLLDRFGTRRIAMRTDPTR